MASLKDKFVKGTMWSLLENVSGQIMSFVVALVLARLLTPSDYGLVALLSIFILISNVLVNLGFSSALVQKKDATDLDFNSVFYLSLTVALLIYLILFLSSPLVANFYNEPSLMIILRVLALTVVFNSVNGVQNAELSRKMLFHLSFRISLISTFVAGIVGVSLAIAGFGAWALVWSSVLGSFSGVVSRWFIIAWRPRLMFSFESLKTLFAFGWKLTLDSLVNIVFDNVYGLIIGKVHKKEDLAYINKGRHLPDLFMSMVNGSLCRAAFPALSQLQDDTQRVRLATRKMVQCSSFLIFPLMAGCAICAPKLIRLLFGGQWDAAIPYAQLACFQFALWPLALVQQSLIALGRSDLLLKINVARKLFGIVIMALTLWISPLVFMAAMAFVYTPVATWSNSWPNRELFGYSFGMQLKDVSLIFINTLLMAAVVFAIDVGFDVFCNANESFFLTPICLFMEFVVGVALYFYMSYKLKMQPLCDYIKMLLPLLERFMPRISVKLKNYIVEAER